MNRYLIAGTPLFLAACATYTGQVAPNIIETQNRHLTRQERGEIPGETDEEKRREALLFQDRPEYAALVYRNDEGATLPRLRVSVAPKYPIVAIKALVKVAFIISETGDVEEARIFEASDDRFSSAALEAVRKWKFYGGTFDGKAAKFLFLVPIVFDGRTK